MRCGGIHARALDERMTCCNDIASSVFVGRTVCDSSEDAPNGKPTAAMASSKVDVELEDIFISL
jgi:hypothetical protein